MLSHKVSFAQAVIRHIHLIKIGPYSSDEQGREMSDFGGERSVINRWCVQGAWWLCVVWMKLSGKRVKGLGFFHRFSILLDGVALQNKNTHPDLQIIC